MQNFWNVLPIILLLIFTFFMWRSMRKMTKENNLLRKKVDKLYSQRNKLARGWLQSVIDPDKITYVDKEPGPGLIFFSSGKLHGIIASRLSQEEMKVMNAVDELLDGTLYQDGDSFQLP